MNIEEQKEPIYYQELMKCKYLGGYIEEGEETRIYDLYLYEGTKYSPRMIIARYGNDVSEYISAAVDELKKIPNELAKKSPCGEGYRRIMKRVPCYRVVLETVKEDEVIEG